LAGEIELVEGDLRSYERVHGAMDGAELVFHEGALPSVPRSVQDPLTTNQVNVSGTLNVRPGGTGRTARRSSRSQPTAGSAASRRGTTTR
jgi:GDP-D-mannose dehydratase